MTVPERDGAGSGSRDIHVTDFDVYFGGSCLLRSADLHLAYQRRYGLVGPNGVGKTTLLRHMAAFDLPKFPRHLRVLHLAALGARERELSAGLEGMEPAAAVAAHAELASIAQQLESLDASTAHARASAILHGLGFSEEKQVAPLSSLSGGWRVRTALAGALFVSPDLLLLDEPTNHLDLEACIWLEHYLVHTFKHTLVLVSHDRSFLNAVCTDCVRAHIQEFIDKFRYNAKRASIVQSRIKTVEKMDAEAPDEPRDAKPWTFAIPAAEPLSRPMLQAETCAFGYGDGPSLFENVDFDVDDKSRVAIVGPNGSGKSTLLKLLLGEIKPRAGEVHRKQQLKVEFFTQHHADQLDLNLSPIGVWRFKSAPRRRSGAPGPVHDRRRSAAQALRAHVGRPEVARRVRAPRLREDAAVLGEPTNHLDMDAIDALAGALKSFRGGVLVVSHDQHFLAAVCDALWVVGKGKRAPAPRPRGAERLDDGRRAGGEPRGRPRSRWGDDDRDDEAYERRPYEAVEENRPRGAFRGAGGGGPPKRQFQVPRANNGDGKAAPGGKKMRRGASPGGGQAQQRAPPAEEKKPEGEDELPERLKGCDPELVKRIEREIMHSGAMTTFDDVAGL
ncbi:ATPase [Aureococcus anophagefferens]|nr:ATPase [Aureococcus anophagefferens]